ncbi:MAG: EAL domain-containing protein [Mariprofundaceae bacterium]|nr:EAL domain-containing protein [Mariprofundaceae bacterium]
MSFTMYGYLRQLDDQSVQLEMNHRSQARLEAIRAILKQHIDMSLSIAAFMKGEIKTHKHVEEDEIKAFADAMLDTHPEELVAIAIIPPEGAGRMLVARQDSGSQLDPPLDRQHLHALITEAPETQAVQDNKHHWLMRRIIAEKSGHGTGYVVSDWDLTAMIAIAIADTHASGLDVETGLIRDGQFTPVHQHLSQLQKTENKGHEKLVWQNRFSLHGMEFEVRTRSSPGAWRQHTFNSPLWMLVLGMAFSLLLAYLTYNRGRYGEQLRQEVARQTRALAKSEREHREAQRIAHLGHWNLDLKNNRLIWSDEAGQIFGISRHIHHATYETFLRRVHPDDRDRVDEAFQASVRNRTPFNIEHRLRMKDNTVKWVNERCITQYDKDGVPLCSIGTVLDITGLKLAEEKLKWLSYYDELTSLPNRRLFADRANQAIAQARRRKSPMAVLFLDLDRFKFINDSLGHSCGDLVLKETAIRLQQNLRTSDTVARIGGDEFAVLLPGADSGQAMRVAYKLRSALQQPYHVSEHELTLDVSIGIAVFPQDGDNDEALLKHADTAMYHAKQDQTHIHYFATEMEEQAFRYLQMGQELARAADEAQLELYYQSQHAISHADSVSSPKISDKGGGGIIGAEALIRWQHPRLGMVSPAEFIPLAEETGQIRTITHWALAEAGRQAVQWEEAGIRPDRIGVNLSAVQLMQKGLAAEIIRGIRESGARPEWIEIEITETAAMRDTETGIAIMRELVDAGISIAIDDFGTGYSSLAYLKRLPAEWLKIDTAFISGLPHVGEDAAIVCSIIAMAHALDMKVIAEGVETQAQLAFLCHEGCDAVQGYYFSKPLPETEATEHLKRHLKATKSIKRPRNARPFNQ